MALRLFGQIHEKSQEALARHLGSWVLQIDGTVDGEYDTIVAVRDAVSGFLLTANRCHSESQGSIRGILEELKAKFGRPLCSISDLRAGILAAVEEVFRGIPIGVCKYHFLRDEGKDLMESRHTQLGLLLRRHGVRAAVKRALAALPSYDPQVLGEVGQGFCSHPVRLAEMEARKVLEELGRRGGEATGYGFPFSLRHLEFVDGCTPARVTLEEFQPIAHRREVEEVVRVLKAVTADPEVVRAREELRGIAQLFNGLRDAMYPKHRGTPLSGEPKRTNGEMEAASDRVVEELGRYLETNIPEPQFVAAKHLVVTYRKWKGRLFLPGLEGILPHTNNGLEQVFRKLRRTIRKRCGDKATGRQLTLNGEKLLLYQNMANVTYRKVVFGGREVAEVLAEERGKLPRVPAMGRKERERLLGLGVEMLRLERIPTTPYARDSWPARREESPPVPEPTPPILCSGGPNGLCLP